MQTIRFLASALFLLMTATATPTKTLEQLKGKAAAGGIIGKTFEGTYSPGKTYRSEDHGTHACTVTVKSVGIALVGGKEALDINLETDAGGSTRTANIAIAPKKGNGEWTTSPLTRTSPEAFSFKESDLIALVNKVDGEPMPK